MQTDIERIGQRMSDRSRARRHWQTAAFLIEFMMAAAVTALVVIGAGWWIAHR